jgi:hypothetical protein
MGPEVTTLRAECFSLDLTLDEISLVYTITTVMSYTKGPGEELVESFFIHLPFSLSSGVLKCVLYKSTNIIWKNGLGPKI